MGFIRRIKRNGRTYLAEVENKRNGTKIRQKTIRYIGLDPVDEKSRFPQKLSALKIDAIRVYGSISSLNFIADKIGLHVLLGDYAGPILSLVFCHCHDYRSVAKTAKWYQTTDLNRILGLQEMSDDSLRQAISGLAKSDLPKLQKSIFQNIVKLCNQEVFSVIYDVTNTYFTGVACNAAKIGRDKEGVRGRRLIQIGLAITNKHGFPIFHQIHRGNVNDSKIFTEAVTFLKHFGMHRGIIVYDRGMTAKESVLNLSSQKWKVIAGVSMHVGIKKIITKMDFSGIIRYRNRVIQNETVFYVVAKKYTLGKTSGRLLFVLNPLKQMAQREERLKGVADLQKEFAVNKTAQSKYLKYLDKNGNVNAHALKRAERFDGLFCIFTTGHHSIQETVNLYFGRGLIEASFRSMKNSLSLRPVTMWLEANVEVHVFICYLAYALLATFRFFLDQARGKRGFGELDGISAEDALDELTNVYRVYFHNAENTINPEDQPLSKLITLSKRQETILKAISPMLLQA